MILQLTFGSPKLITSHGLKNKSRLAKTISDEIGGSNENSLGKSVSRAHMKISARVRLLQ